VIEMSVGQQDLADIGDFGWNWRPIKAAQIPGSLKQAGIDNDLSFTIVHQITRPCDRSRCAEKGDAETIGRALSQIDPCFALEDGHAGLVAGMVPFLSLVHGRGPASHDYVRERSFDSRTPHAYTQKPQHDCCSRQLRRANTGGRSDRSPYPCLRDALRTSLSTYTLLLGLEPMQAGG
jgi:hypothetical protein